jgi:hypothetical protein
MEMGEVDTLVVWRLDRLGRTAKKLNIPRAVVREAFFCRVMPVGPSLTRTIVGFLWKISQANGDVRGVPHVYAERLF